MTKQKLCIVTCLALYKEKPRVPEGKFKGDSGTVILFRFSHVTLGLNNGIKLSKYVEVWKCCESGPPGGDNISLGVHILTLGTHISLLFSSICC